MCYVSVKFYGTRPWAAYDALRDSVMPEILTGNACLSLAVYIAASIVNDLKPQLSEEWMMARQSTNYQHLRHVLKNQHSYPWDWTISCVLVAGFADITAGHPARGLKHTKAAFDMLQDLRNIQRMRLSSGSIAFKAFLLTGMPMMFTTRRVLETALEDTCQNIRQIQRWTCFRRKEPCFSHDCPRHFVDLTSNDETAPQLASQCCYWTGRQRVLGPKSMTGGFFGPKSPEIPESDERMLMANIYTFNSILSNLHDDDSTVEKFLDDIDKMLANSLDDGIDLRSPPRFAWHSCTQMITACAEKHGLWFYHGPEYPLPAMRTWEALEFVELMMLASPETRRKITRALRHWLYCDSDEIMEELFEDELELEAIQYEIRSNWETSKASEY